MSSLGGMPSDGEALYAHLPARAPPLPGIRDPRTDCIPWTAGGNLPIDRAVEVTPAHYLQTDKSLNADLWDLFPVFMDAGMLQFLWDTINDELNDLNGQHGLTFDTTVLLTGVPLFELGGLTVNLLSLNLLRDFLIDWHPDAAHLPTVASVLSPRKARGEVEPLPELVARLERSKTEANQLFETGNPSDLITAIEKYWYCLLDLHPWSATPLLFSADEAYELGIAQLQADLWCNLAMTTCKLAHTAKDDAAKDEAMIFADLSASIVIDMRFAPRTPLGKAYKIAGEMYAQLLRAAAPPAAHLIGKNKEILSRLIQESAQDKSGWAHRDCITDHSGCGCGQDEVYAALGLDPSDRPRVFSA